MRRLYNLARGSQVPARLLNTVQDEQLGLIAASDTADGATAVALTGGDGRWWTTPTAGLGDGTLRVVDASVDWRQRRVWGVFRVLGAADRRPGQASDHVPNDPTAAPNAMAFNGWTGTGGLGAAGATVANGTPPAVADNQYAVLLDEGATSADRVWLYARPSDGALCVYNDGGATLHAELLVWGAAALPTLGATPSVYPSPIYVLWLPPSLAAARPTPPTPVEQIAVHRATDTGAITLWDGAAWHALGGASILTTRGDLLRRGVASDERYALGPRGHVLRAGAQDPTWSEVSGLGGGLPAASADYAAAIYWDTITGGHFVCTNGGYSAAWSWRVLDAHDGARGAVDTSDDAWTTLATVTLLDYHVTLLDVEVVGVNADRSGAVAARGSAAYLDGAVVEPLTLLIGDASRVRLTTSGLDVNLQVRGVVGDFWAWRGSIVRRVEVEHD